jgi:cold shock CspA family protein
MPVSPGNKHCQLCSRRHKDSQGGLSGVYTLVEETGTVKWFIAERGYGFITRNGGGKDVFVDISALEQWGLSGLSEGDRVIVGFSEGRKGLEAARVRFA